MVCCSLCGKHIDGCTCSKTPKVVEHRPNETNKIVDPSVNKNRKVITK